MDHVYVEDWARDYVLTTDLAHKQRPPAPPAEWRPRPAALRLTAPGRPPELRVAQRAARSPRLAALSDPRQRARLLHTFWHHELQAAELMCWALLAFSEAEPEFRRGLLRIAGDEIRHMDSYRAHIERLGYAVGSFEVRDWFWERVPRVADAVGFVASMGMGFEAANLDHAPRFAEGFRRAGDEAGATLQEQIASDELAHVRFATTWFGRWTGGCGFDDWRRRLPEPLSPLLMRGKVVRPAERLAAGMSDEFVQALTAWIPER